jgi:hypothetical protein
VALSDQHQLIADWARAIVTQTAPEELPLFRVTSVEYFKHPNKLPRGQKDPETLLALISLWAFPLTAWFWRKRVIMERGSRWAFLDASLQRQPWLHQEPLSPRFALTLGLLVGFVFCVLLLIVRFGLRLGTPEAIRQTDQYKILFYTIQVTLAVLLQLFLRQMVA